MPSIKTNEKAHNVRYFFNRLRFWVSLLDNLETLKQIKFDRIMELKRNYKIWIGKLSKNIFRFSNRFLFEVSTDWNSIPKFPFYSQKLYRFLLQGYQSNSQYLSHPSQKLSKSLHYNFQPFIFLPFQPHYSQLDHIYSLKQKYING